MELEGLQNGIEHKWKPPPPLRPKPSRHGTSNGRFTPTGPPTAAAVRTSSSTSSSETSVSHSWNPTISAEHGHRRPMPPPRTSSIPHNEEDTSPLSSSPKTRIYPSTPYTLDSKIIISLPEMSPATESTPLHLQELVEKYSDIFPLQIKVLHGYSGQTSQLTISSGDYYNVHFVKHQEVVSMSDKLGFSYTIPLNSSFKFGLVYSSDAAHHDTHIYERVADLLALSPLPRVVCPTRDVAASDERSAIAVDEILIVKRVIRPKLRKKSLEVLSLKTQSTKFLPLDCEGHFTLNPRRNQIYLLELVKCIPDVFPCTAVMFLSRDATSNHQRISHSVLNAVVTLSGQKTETSLIASSVTYSSCEESGGEMKAQVSEHLVDIPVDDRLSDVMVLLVDTSQCGLQEMLNHKTRTLFETFDVTRVKSWYDAPNNSTGDITQNVLYASIGRGSKGFGIQVDKPLAAFKDAPNSRDDMLYATVYSPSLDDTDSSSGYFASSSNEFATQYEQPQHHIPPTTAACVTFPETHFSSHLPAKGRSEVHYDPLPSLRPSLSSASSSRSLRRSRSQYTLPLTDLTNDCYEDMHSTSPFTNPPRYIPRQSVESKLEQLMAASTALQSQVSGLLHRISYVEEQLRELSQMNVIIKRLLEGISALTLQANQLQCLSCGKSIRTDSDKVHLEQNNQHYLATLALPQVYYNMLTFRVLQQSL